MNLIDFENQKRMRRGQRRSKSFEIYFDVSNTVLFLYQKKKKQLEKREWIWVISKVKKIEINKERQRDEKPKNIIGR